MEDNRIILEAQSVIKQYTQYDTVVTASAQSKKIVQEFKPDLAIGTGGYV